MEAESALEILLNIEAQLKKWIGGENARQFLESITLTAQIQGLNDDTAKLADFTLFKIIAEANKLREYLGRKYFELDDPTKSTVVKVWAVEPFEFKNDS